MSDSNPRQKQKRSSTFKLRLTQAEREKWEALAEAVGMGKNLSKFVRHCVERRTLPAPIPEINRETYWELGKIGVNLNQIAHATNQAVKAGSPISADPRPEILKLTKKIEEVRLELINLQETRKL
jgi:hypothetical protein